MGKNVQQQESMLLHHHHSPKCLWGIFHHLNHYRWNTVKKRLPYKRGPTASKPVAAEGGDPENKATAASPVAAEMQEKADPKTENTPAVEAKPADSGSASKSMKSRLKALLFTDEGSKRRGRGRHRRSSSCPTTQQTAPLAAVVPAPEPSLIATHNIAHTTSLASLLDPPLPTICEEGQLVFPPKHTCAVCAAMLKMNSQKPQTDIYAPIEPPKPASLQESKLFLKALDLLNVRKEVLMKILHDSQQASKMRKRLDKSMTFPAPGGSLRRGRDPKCAAHEKLQENKKMCTDPELLDNVAKHSPAIEQKSRHRYGLWNFKNLREKLRFAIKESKKEKHRIVMDAVLDKIPRGRRMPKDVKEAAGSSPQFMNSQIGKTSENNNNIECMKRARSFHESPERYNQLLETCFHRETQPRIPEQPEFRVPSETPTPATETPSPSKTLERYMSLPDLRGYSSLRSSEDNNSQYDTSSVRTATGNNLNIADGERKVMYTPTGSEYHTLSDPNSDDQIPGGFQDAGDTFDGNVIEPTISSNSVPEMMNLLDTTSCTEKLVSAPEGDLLAGQANEMKAEACSVAAESSVEMVEKEGSPVTGLNILMDLHVDNKNKAQFDYVKDVLELSGFSGIQLLESWQSAQLPLNPSLFEEVEEGCLLAQPDCTGNEAGGTCDHLLLFDLINHVLLEMYERSFSYWPKPLTCHSRIRRMPVGYRVLEEVWASINWMLSWFHEHQRSVIEDAVSHDLSKGNNWMNLQFDAECAGLELEELILDDLLDELIYDDLLF